MKGFKQKDFLPQAISTGSTWSLGVVNGGTVYISDGRVGSGVAGGSVHVQYFAFDCKYSNYLFNVLSLKETLVFFWRLFYSKNDILRISIYRWSWVVFILSLFVWYIIFWFD